MRLSIRCARRATATAMAASLAVIGLLSAGCTPQTSGTKVISGTIKGADGKIVDVMVGFDVIDGAGHKMDLGGGKVGYSVIQRLNHCVPTNGATASQKCPGTGRITGYNWSLGLPAAARTVYIEVYPKAPTGSDWVNNYNGYTGVAAGSTNVSSYSLTYKRAIPVTYSRSNVKISVPKVCGVAGGTTGSLYGHLNGWRTGTTGRVNAWSLASNMLDTQGFGIGLIDKNGNYRVNGLQKGQRYGLIASGGGFYRNVVNYTNSTTSATLVPSACAQKEYNF